MATFNKTIQIEDIKTAPTTGGVNERVFVIPGADGGWTYAYPSGDGGWRDDWTDRPITPRYWARELPTLQEIKDASC